MTTPADRFRAFLARHGYTTARAAAELGIDRSMVSLLQSGRRRPSLRVAAAIEDLTAGYVRAVDWAREQSAA